MFLNRWLRQTYDYIINLSGKQNALVWLAVISFVESSFFPIPPDIMLIPMILFFAVNFVLIRWIGKKLKFNEYDLIPLNFTTLARNSPLSLAIAVAAFPNRPLISLALVVGPLIELPSLAVIAGIINRLKRVDQ